MLIVYSYRHYRNILFLLFQQKVSVTAVLTSYLLTNITGKTVLDVDTVFIKVLLVLMVIQPYADSFTDVKFLIMEDSFAVVTNFDFFVNFYGRTVLSVDTVSIYC